VQRLLGNEQHRQHHHGDVVVPSLPADCLIIANAALALPSSKMRSTR
jgi:hypothetical protein